MYGSILIIDDNPSILTALKICLAPVFEHIVTLSKPDGVLTAIKEERPDAILMDMNFSLGVNTGNEGLMWLRVLQREHSNIPVVLITAYADVSLAVKGMKLGASDFVTKPWDNDNLIRILKDAIDKSKTVVSLDQLETDHIRRVVEQTGGNISEAAKLLGITRQTLYKKLQKP